MISLVGTYFRRELYAYSTTLYWVFDFFKFVIFPGATALILYRRYGIHPKHYGLRGIAKHETWVSFACLVLLLVFILNIAYYASLQLGSLFFQAEAPQLFYQEITPTGFMKIPVVLYLAISAGLVEECVFRGLPLLIFQKWFPTKLPRLTYVVSTAMIFGAVHWGNGLNEVMATFVFGFIAAAIYLRLQNISPLVAAHTIADMGWIV